MAPPTMTALVTGQRNLLSRLYNGIASRNIGHGSLISHDVPIPRIAPTEILVKVHTVALNPTDWAHIDLVGPARCIVGCDYSGTVAEVGEQAIGEWKVGDKIAGAVHGGLYPDRGAFAQYLKIEGDLAWKRPEAISERDATTYGVSACTSMQALYHNLDVPWPLEDGTPQVDADGRAILIYAASTAAGLFALQMAKLAGWTVIATCSPRNFDLVKRYGATAAYDYKSPTALRDIKTTFPHVTRAMDCISKGDSTEFCASVLKNNGKVVTLLNRGTSKTPGVEYKWILAYTLMGKPFSWFQPLGPKFPAVPADREALVRFYKLLPSFTQVLRPAPVRVIPGGFDGLHKGLDMLRKGVVSGEKLVVELESTV